MKINYFAKHSITTCIDGIVHLSTVASVSWFKYHMNKDYYGEPITLWECDIFKWVAPIVSFLYILLPEELFL